MTTAAPIRRGFTVAELLVALALTALLMTAIAFAMHGAEQSNRYNRTKAELVARSRGVLDRIARDVRCAEATIVANDGTALNVMVVRQAQDGSMTSVWRQYRFTGDEVLVYEDASAIPLPPTDPEGVSSESLTGDVDYFHVETLVSSTRSITETLACLVITTGSAPEGQATIPLKEGPYVLKLSQTQFDELQDMGQLQEGVDVDPRPSYEPDDDPDTYWLCLEDCQAPETYYEPWADWDFEDVLVKVTETANSVDMEVFAGHGGYEWNILGPDGDMLWEDLSGNQSYSYTPYCSDADTVSVELDLQRDNVQTGGEMTATQRKAIF
ncbi:MAG: prepilin-type N-terminal cleavage/methylation domain-containing protein [Phycisphaerae bacterium]